MYNTVSKNRSHVHSECDNEVKKICSGDMGVVLSFSKYHFSSASSNGNGSMMGHHMRGHSHSHSHDMPLYPPLRPDEESRDMPLPPPPHPRGHGSSHSHSSHMLPPPRPDQKGMMPPPPRSEDHDMMPPPPRPEGHNMMPPPPRPGMHPNKGMHMHMTNWVQQPDEVEDIMENPVSDIELPLPEPFIVYDPIMKESKPVVTPYNVDEGQDTVQVPEPLVVYDSIEMVKVSKEEEEEPIPVIVYDEVEMIIREEEEPMPIVVYDSVEMVESKEDEQEDNSDGNQRRNLRNNHYRGYKHMHNNGVMRSSRNKNFRMEKSFAPIGYDWKTERCIRMHASVFNDLTPKCSDSIRLLDSSFDKLVSQQEENDHQECIYRGAALLVIVLTMIASWLFILMGKSTDLSNASDRNLVRLNQALAVTVLGAIGLFAPVFLILIIPSFAIVQIAHFCCCRDTSTHDRAGYEQVSQENVARPKDQVFMGVPVDI